MAAALVDPGGRVLLQRRSPGRSMAGLWEFPGGKVEPHERPEQALVRELEEELGIAVDWAALSPAAFASADSPEGTGRHMLLLLYICREWSGEPRNLDSAELAWVIPADMTRLPMPPADEPLIPILERLL